MTAQKPRMKNVTAGSSPNYNRGIRTFSFGDPEPCLNNRYTDYVGVFQTGDGLYEPPISLDGIYSLLGVNAQHGPILYFKRNMILKWLIQNNYISRQELLKFAQDYVIFANAYLQPIYNRVGTLKRVRHLPAMKMRYTTQKGVYAMINNDGSITRFNAGEVIQIKEYDPKQGIYGMPQYYGGIQSALLSEDSTLFRRKYFKNGAHLGYIFSMADPSLSPEEEDKLEAAILNSKGAGNFRSMFINNRTAKGDAEKAIKIIPIGDHAQKDEFERIRKITSQDMLSMHRAQEALSGQMSGDQSAGLGNLDRITSAYYNNEVVPLQQEIATINEFLPSYAHINFNVPSYSDLLQTQGDAA
ncbi:phage portal protein [Pseudoalteromonas luteoviolacea]|uniref:Phage portal protein n=1 Tax=Pseudoalteromonas luteoviolacea S4060-1 TaxID=1365257 RepID=A0A167JJB5_9GAMM|nr:phage portal protein [Pseudoalteromonas luteoviolacea]KZN61199.1 phage portal protein [Pseudoalteromonas luteoviolacea S4060-1]